MSNVTAFLAQNQRAAETLTADDIDGFAEHHAGGLYVLGCAFSAGSRYVKMHDSWGDDENVVVHQYDPEEDDGADTVEHFATGREAFARFLQIIGED